jgi:transposase
VALIYQKDPRSGITYAYEATYWWDKEKKQSRCKRTLVGRLDEKTGKVRPTDGRCRKAMETKSTPKDLPTTTTMSTKSTEGTAHKFYGATYLFDAVGEKLGLTADLKQCFPKTWDKILSLAYYLILEGDSAYRFEKWGLIHKHPFGRDIPSQRSSELFASITDDQKNEFFRLQASRRIEKEYWAYDITSISSYSETLKQVQYGKSKEDDKLPQINLALLFGEQSGLPFYYRKLAGNIPDVKTVRRLLDELDIFGFSKIKLLMDRGFYSKANINGMLKERLKFLMSAKTSTIFVRQGIDSVYDDIRIFPDFIHNMGLYGTTVLMDWNYNYVDRPKGDNVSETRRLYLHVYFNAERAAEEEMKFNAKLSNLKNELESGDFLDSNEKFYRKFFETAKRSGSGFRTIPKLGAIEEACRYFGCFALISNEKMDAEAAIKLYRARDVVEKAFGNLKDRLNMRRFLVSSEQALDGKLFVEFVALIYLSYINKQMHDQDLYKNFSMNQVLDKLDVIECFETPGRKLRVGEVLDKQNMLFTKLGVAPLTSS